MYMVQHCGTVVYPCLFYDHLLKKPSDLEGKYLRCGVWVDMVDQLVCMVSTAAWTTKGIGQVQGCHLVYLLIYKIKKKFCVFDT